MDLSLRVTIVAAIAGILALLIDVLSKTVRIWIVTIALLIVVAGLLFAFNPLHDEKPHVASSLAPHEIRVGFRKRSSDTSNAVCGTRVELDTLRV